jgi:hypothetical protein
LARSRDGDQALLLHQAPNHILGDVHGLLGERGVHPAVAIAPVVALGDISHDAAHLGVLVCNLEPCSMVKVGAARQADFLQKIGKRVCRSQGINAGRQVKPTRLPSLM